MKLLQNIIFISSLLALPTTVAFAEGDAAKGANQFKKCAACHAVDKPAKKIGPHLMAVIGRKVGSIEGFKYSADLVKMGEDGKLWDDVLFDQYIENPKKVAPKGTMSFGGIKKPEDRADLLAYLKTIAAPTP
jgi:cytochrome c